MMVCAWCAYWSRTALASSSASRTPSTRSFSSTSPRRTKRTWSSITVEPAAKIETRSANAKKRRRAVPEGRRLMTESYAGRSGSSPLRSVHHQLAELHPHPAEHAEGAALGRGEVDVDGLVERQGLLHADPLDDHFGHAGPVGLAGDAQVHRLALRHLHLGGREAGVGERELDGARRLGGRLLGGEGEGGGEGQDGDDGEEGAASGLH